MKRTLGCEKYARFLVCAWFSAGARVRMLVHSRQSLLGFYAYSTPLRPQHGQHALHCARTSILLF